MDEGHCALRDVLGVFLIEVTFTPHKILKLSISKTFKQRYYCVNMYSHVHCYMFISQIIQDMNKDKHGRVEMCTCLEFHPVRRHTSGNRCTCTRQACLMLCHCPSYFLLTNYQRLIAKAFFSMLIVSWYYMCLARSASVNIAQASLQLRAS